VRRYLILAASMGDGHLRVADQLRQRLVARGDCAEVVDILSVLPFEIGPLLRRSYAAMLRRTPFLYDAIYRAFFVPRSGARLRADPLVAASSPAVRRLIEEHRPDAVVSTFHLCAQIAGRLRMSGQLAAPSIVVVTDFVAHRMWLHPGSDAFVCVHQAVADDAARVTGRPSFAAAPAVAEEFLSGDALPRAVRRKELREQLGVEEESPIVLVSAGAWGSGGVGGLAGAVRTIASPRHTTLVLCGRDERLREALAELGGGVVAMGWRDDVPRLMRACDLLVENAAGQTAMEAFAVGLPVLSYRPLPGHGRAGVLRMAELGLSSFAADDEELPALVEELARPGSARAATQVARGRALFTTDPVAFLGPVVAPT
jgi:UDP-N-acetylglucosamine:LPS N-acetylglucosamine transferase